MLGISWIRFTDGPKEDREEEGSYKVAEFITISKATRTFTRKKEASMQRN